MQIVELKRPVTIGDRAFPKNEKLAVTEAQFDELLLAGAVTSVEIPFRELLPAKFREKTWFELREFFLKKAARSKAKDEASFCERYGLPVTMLSFLRVQFTPAEKENGTDS
jgi:hypothetical protein